VAQRFALGDDKEPMQLLFKRVESLHGRVRFATLTQKGMELIQGVGITGQEVIVLQCLHGDSPLAYVVPVRAPLFQSGEAPSRGPHGLEQIWII
jgi:hypothetical protein